MKEDPKEKMLLMAEIVGVHGVTGTVKLKVFSDAAESLPKRGPLTDGGGERQFRIIRLSRHDKIWLAVLEGVSDRTAAERLKGTKLYLSRDSLPEIRKEDTYYHADLVGLSAQDEAGNALGRVIAVADFGAGDLLEIQPPAGQSFYVPFRKAFVPKVDMAAGALTVVLVPGLRE